MGMTKLDSYDYELFKGLIRIHIDGTKDPSLVDIFSEIDRYEGRIYVEGRRYLYLGDYQLYGNSDNDAYLDLKVVEQV